MKEVKFMWHELKKLIVGKLGGDVDAVELARRVLVLDHLAQESEERAGGLEAENDRLRRILATTETELRLANQEIVHLTKRLTLADSPPPPTLDSNRPAKFMVGDIVKITDGKHRGYLGTITAFSAHTGLYCVENSELLRGWFTPEQLRIWPAPYVTDAGGVM